MWRIQKQVHDILDKWTPSLLKAIFDKDRASYLAPILVKITNNYLDFKENSQCVGVFEKKVPFVVTISNISGN